MSHSPTGSEFWGGAELASVIEKGGFTAKLHAEFLFY